MRENACWVLGTVQIILIIRTLICSTEKVYGSSPYSPIHSTKWYYLYISPHSPSLWLGLEKSFRSYQSHVLIEIDGWERWTRAGILVLWIEIDPIPDDQTYKLFLFFFIASSLEYHMFQAIHRAVKASIGHVTFSSIQTQRIGVEQNFRSIENPGCIYPFAKYRGEDLYQLGFSTISYVR